MTNIETWRYQYRDNYQAARYLLANEAQGFAIDATTYGTGEAIAAYTGGPVGGTVTVKSAGDAGDLLISKSLDESNLVQTGTSPKMVLWNSAPYVRWSPHNLLLQSQTLGTTWSTAELSVSSNAAVAPDGTMTAEKLVESGAVDVHQLNQTYTTAAVVVTFSAYLKAAGRTHACLTLRTDSAQRYGAVFDLSNGTVTDTEAENGIAGTDNDIISVGDGWYRCSVTILSLGANDTAQISPSDSATPTFVQAAPSYDGDATSGIYAWGAQVNRGYSPTPYLVTTTAARIGVPQEYDAAEAMFGVLVEPASTNIANYSEDFSNGWWSPTGATVSANATTAPDGSSTADKIVESVGGTAHAIGNLNQMTVTNGVALTLSIFAKAAGRSWFGLNFYDGTTHWTFFDVTNGVIGTTAAGNTSTITSVGNGWYRCTVTRTTTSTALFLGVDMAEADNDASYSGDGSSGLYLWGAQAEEHSIATSYIPTLGATSTRATDTVSALTNTFPSGTTAMSVVAYLKKITTGVQHAIVLLTDNGVNQNYLRLWGVSDTRWTVRNANVEQAALDMSDPGTNSFKIAGRATTNDFHMALDGTLDATPDTSGTMPTTYDTLKLNTDTDGTQRMMRIYHIIVVPRAYTNTELQTVTT